MTSLTNRKGNREGPANENSYSCLARVTLGDNWIHLATDSRNSKLLVVKQKPANLPEFTRRVFRYSSGAQTVCRRFPDDGKRRFQGPWKLSSLCVPTAEKTRRKA